jgi:hypothetical protein
MVTYWSRGGSRNQKEETEVTIIKRTRHHRCEAATRVELAEASQLLTGTNDRPCLCVFRTAPTYYSHSTACLLRLKVSNEQSNQMRISPLKKQRRHHNVAAIVVWRSIFNHETPFRAKTTA